MTAPVEPAPEQLVTLKLPRKLKFLLEMHPYKVAWGGRNGLKSWNFARALLTLGAAQDLRILCAREVQKSLADSVHLLLKDQIKRLGYQDLYEVTDNAIRGTARDTLIRFSGLSDQTEESIKSFEGFDIFWFEEAQRISKRSFQIALPTLFRTPRAEAWISFNPDMESDEVWERFVVHPPEGAVVVQTNWRDAQKLGFFPPEQEKLRQFDLTYNRVDYDNIWEGKPRSVVAGAIYTAEITDLIAEGRYRPMPYDPRFPVHRVWDLGWNDLMTVVMVQKPHPSALAVINYIEDSQVTYPQMIATMDKLRYKWGIDYLPHDGTHHHPTSGTNARKQLIGLGCRVKDIPKSDAESRIRAARMMFPRVYIDNSKRDTPPDRPQQAIGAAHLLNRLRRYKRRVPPGTLEPAAPVHDANSHGADAWGGLAEIVDQIRNDDGAQAPTLPAFSNPNPGTGMLG